MLKITRPALLSVKSDLDDVLEVLICLLRIVIYSDVEDFGN
jgi:hypothetical protein